MKVTNRQQVKELLNEVLPLDTAQHEKFFEGSEIGGEIHYGHIADCCGITGKDG